MADEAKLGEMAYPERIGEEGRRWLRTKPFRGELEVSVRHLVDVGYVVRLLELREGVRLVELGCGSGWLTRFAARCGAEAVGYDIAPGMIEIAREQAAAEGVEARFEVADMEMIDLAGAFDACLLYESLHHSSRPETALAAARRALRPGGVLLLTEPNWTHRYRGRRAAEAFGTTERGLSSHRLKGLVRAAGFERVERFHPNRRRLYGNGPADVVAHLAEPLAYRALAPFWTQVWLRARARP